MSLVDRDRPSTLSSPYMRGSWWAGQKKMRLNNFRSHFLASHQEIGVRIWDALNEPQRFRECLFVSIPKVECKKSMLPLHPSRWRATRRKQPLRLRSRGWYDWSESGALSDASIHGSRTANGHRRVTGFCLGTSFAAGPAKQVREMGYRKEKRVNCGGG